MKPNKSTYVDEYRFPTGQHYTIERNKQIILSLLKDYGIKRVVVSPGATNFALVGSMQCDPYFEMYSCVDERAAAYMAIGMATQTGKPVVLSCTGATASRNYMSALTEAWNNNVPILVITSSLSLASVGHLRAQVTDRAHSPYDMVCKSYQFDNIKDGEDEWNVTVKCNEALATLLETRKPILINVCTTYSRDFSIQELPPALYIPTIQDSSNKPTLPSGRIGIFIGSHSEFTKQQVESIERFCMSHNAVIFCDHTSGYNGKYRVNMSIPFGQEKYTSPNKGMDLIIHIGEITGDYYTVYGIWGNEVWRVSPDGSYADFFHRLTKVFKLKEEDFFSIYADENVNTSHEFLQACRQESTFFYNKLPEVELSNIWIAQHLSSRLPKDSRIHFGIFNSLRSWDFFYLPKSVKSTSNVGGFGIDGCVSSLIGAALVHPDKLYFGIVGDLAFYYDANILLNTKLPNNIRLIIVNNGLGIEFRNYCHDAMIAFGDGVRSYVAADGHFGKQFYSSVIDLCKHAKIEYKRVTSKDEFIQVEEDFLKHDMEQAMVIEVITMPENESDALRKYRQLIIDPPVSVQKKLFQKWATLKRVIKKFLIQ